MSSWNNSLFGCFDPIGTCCFGCWCPCLLYGKTKARKDNPSDPDPSGCNGSCGGWFCLSLCGVQCILQTIDRGDTRKKYGIDGNGCTDCLTSWCCACCGLIQQEKEVKERAQMLPAGGYQKPAAMVYPTQPQQV